MLETLLADANKSKDRYQADYLKAHKESLRLSAALETIREGRGGDMYVSVKYIKWAKLIME